MKLHEEFKLFENMWDMPVGLKEATGAKVVIGDAELYSDRYYDDDDKYIYGPNGELYLNPAHHLKLPKDGCNTVSIFIYLDNSGKKAEFKGLSKAKALNKLLSFIKALSEEERQKYLAFEVIYDYAASGDADGELILALDSIGTCSILDDDTLSEERKEEIINNPAHRLRNVGADHTDYADIVEEAVAHALNIELN